MLVVESPEILLAKRIRVLIETTGFSRGECHEVIMSVKNPPSEEQFNLAYSAAVILIQDPIAQRQEQRYSEELNLGLPSE